MSIDAFAGLRALDFSTGLAGPLVGMFLTDFGADVVKVETPEGDPARANPGFAMWNRGKRSVVVERESGWLREMVRGADILITNGPGQLARLGLDHDAILEENGRLVLVEMPPYLAGFTPWIGGDESAELLAATMGQSWRQPSFSGAPVDPVYPTVLYAHGVWATACTVAALVERERSGAGQRVTVSGVNAIQVLTTSGLTVNPDLVDIATAVGAGGRHPMYTRHLAGDGKWLASGALGAKFETAMLEVLGLSWVLDDPRLDGRIENIVTAANVPWIRAAVAEAMLRRPRDEWLSIIEAAGIPCGPLDDREDWLDHPQVAAIDMRVEVDDPERGHVVMPGVPIRLVDTPGRVRGPAPALGQHTGAVAAWEPQAPATPWAPVRPGPLTGFRVLDSGTFVATPFAGSLLSELGAEVVKVEPPAGDPFRRSGYFANRGMKSLAVDLQSEAGRSAFLALAEVSDAIVVGLRPGVTTKLGIDHEALSALNPGIVSASISAYGEGGDLGDKGGVDTVIQAMCGMMKAQGGDDEPVSSSIPVCDMSTAAMLALTVCIGLFHRERTGRGQRAWASLVGTATFLQGGEILRFAGRPPARVGGRDFPGPTPVDRLYEVADGWVRLQAPGASPTEVAAVLDPHGGPTDDLAGVLAALAGREAVRRLTAAGLDAVRVRKVREVIHDGRLGEAEFSHVFASDAGSYISAPGRMAIFSRTSRFGIRKPPGAGEHTQELLLAAGVTQDVVEDLAREGAVVLGGRMHHQLAAAYR